VKTNPSLHIYLRIILVSIFVGLLGLTPHPHAVDRFLENAGRSLANGDILTASQNIADAGESFPWWYELNLIAGRLALQAGDPKAAIQYFERPGAISHLSSDDLILLGDAYHQTGDPLMAEKIWRQVSEQDASSQVYERLANFYLLQKDYVSAITMLQHLLDLNPSDISLYYQIGSLYAATDPIKALPFLAQASEIDPAIAIQAQNLHDKIRTASLSDDLAYTLLIAGRQLASWGDWELATVAFQNAVKIQPEYTDAWAFLSEAQQQMELLLNGSVSGAGLHELENAIRLDPNSPLANTLMGLYWERQGDYSQAQLYLEHAIASSPKDSFLYSELGNILTKAGDLPAAQSAYEKAIQLSPQEPLFYRLLAEFALQNQIQIRELALPAARKAVNLDPKNPASLDVMAQVLLMLQDYRSAERFALDALQLDPSYSPAYLHLGLAYLYLNEPDLARQYLGLAETVSPTSLTASQAKRLLDYYFP
jgi:tetratricopeptide (TPR) repeat protein